MRATALHDTRPTTNTVNPTTAPVEDARETGVRATSAADGSGAMFDRIARRYDLLNRVLSLGIDRSWRRRAVQATGLRADSEAEVLDLATGTADLALELSEAFPRARVLGVDPSPRMLEIGRRKCAGEERIELVEGDAQALVAPDASFDAVTIAFGIRNVPDREAALREMARVTRPGGRVVVLELAEPRSGILGVPARFWVHHVVPRLGALLSGDREYRYLQTSIARFPSAEEFAATMNCCGLEVIDRVSLTFGAEESR